MVIVLLSGCCCVFFFLVLSLQVVARGEGAEERRRSKKRKVRRRKKRVILYEQDLSICSFKLSAFSLSHFWLQISIFVVTGSLIFIANGSHPFKSLFKSTIKWISIL